MQNYGEIIQSVQQALADFEQTEELLEYPEVQADKAYYLSVLEKYNQLRTLKDKLAVLQDAVSQQEAALSLLDEAQGDEKAEIWQEISLQRQTAQKVSSQLAALIGLKGITEFVCCRMRIKNTEKIGMQFYQLVVDNLQQNGAKIGNVKTISDKNGITEEIAFEASGSDVLTRLELLCGVHKVNLASSSAQIYFAVTPQAQNIAIDERDLKIDLFHSHGAGGQNINKVETAVRITHLPTNTVVVCQDERSQLKNKRRALETLQVRLNETNARNEKQRMDADFKRQFGGGFSPITIDVAAGTLTDTRIASAKNMPFPPTTQQFSNYINALIATRN